MLAECYYPSRVLIIGLLFKLKWSGSQKRLKCMLAMKWGQQVLFQGLNGPSFGWQLGVSSLLILPQ